MTKPSSEEWRDEKIFVQHTRRLEEIYDADEDGILYLPDIQCFPTDYKEKDVSYMTFYAIKEMKKMKMAMSVILSIYLSVYTIVCT